MRSWLSQACEGPAGAPHPSSQIPDLQGLRQSRLPHSFLN